MIQSCYSFNILAYKIVRFISQNCTAVRFYLVKVIAGELSGFILRYSFNQYWLKLAFPCFLSRVEKTDRQKQGYFLCRVVGTCASLSEFLYKRFWNLYKR